MIHPILKRLSHSSVLLLHSCPRKYQLTKLLSRRDEDTDDLTFGDVVGYGIQQLLLGRSTEDIWLEVFVRWKLDTVDFEEKTDKKKKTFWHALHALAVFEGRYKNVLLEEYDVATFHGKPACELGFRITIGNSYEYRGYVDVVLIHKRTREIVVLEIKTTGDKFISPAKYQNSGQGLGYSLVCDYIAQEYPDVSGSSYKILYFVYLTVPQEFHQLPFPKSHSMRAMWIKQLLQEVEHIEGYDKDALWPMYGESCRSWNKDCAFLGLCQMSDEMLLANAKPELKEEEFHFDISLMDLINSQLERSQEAVVL